MSFEFLLIFSQVQIFICEYCQHSITFCWRVDYRDWMCVMLINKQYQFILWLIILVWFFVYFLQVQQISVILDLYANIVSIPSWTISIYFVINYSRMIFFLFFFQVQQLVLFLIWMWIFPSSYQPVSPSSIPFLVDYTL